MRKKEMIMRKRQKQRFRYTPRGDSLRIAAHLADMGDFSKSTDKLYYAANAAVRENAKQVAAHNATYESKRSWPPEFDMIFMRGLPDILSVIGTPTSTRCSLAKRSAPKSCVGCRCA